MDEIEPFPVFVDLSGSDAEKARLCLWDCCWGATHYHLSTDLNHATLVPSYLIFPVEWISPSVTFYHGTTKGNASKILSSGALLPPQVTGFKTHGLNSEGDLRYVGIDRSAAEAHDKGVVLDIEYSGWLAKTHLGLPPAALLHLLESMPEGIQAIEFWENGRAVAFRLDAKVIPKRISNNGALKVRLETPARKGLRETLKVWFS